ncbi:Bax inhibitor-1/YccA family protein [Cesiribacter andamanensis]|uniref:Putative membrane protein n=1 Tax=Cesiribacter andamanensis AMV16 TaxID=1279009 RepID=M7N1Y1_9BACT|nr:Bax inhibitor-1/YccA family protein [Cesiribacter andamanensis]EMR01287.1 putative membrane protein [Cesiribacter andamanensis AMV16]
MRSSNPVLKKAFSGSQYAEETDVMTIKGTVDKSFLLILIVFAGAAIGWTCVSGGLLPAGPLLMGTGIICLVLAVVTAFKMALAKTISPVYALLKGIFLGAITLFFEIAVPGIALQAVGLTFGVFICMLVAYKTGTIRATEGFRAGLVAATGAVALVYVLSFALSLFGMQVPYIHESGLIGIGFSLVVVVIAALNLVLDFAFIEEGAAAGAPKHMEWFAAFSLLITLVWLYMEILRLLAKLASRD